MGWIAEGQSLRAGLIALAVVAGVASILSLVGETREPTEARRS